MGLALYATILLLFASFCTCHLWLCLRLLKSNVTRALMALVVFPLAPYFALGQGMRRLPSLWIGLGSSYLFFLLLALVLPESM